MSNEPEQHPHPELVSPHAPSDAPGDAAQISPADERSFEPPLLAENGDDFPLLLEIAPPSAPQQERIPNFGHVAILVLIAACGLFAAALLAQLGVHFHLFGVASVEQAAAEIHYTLGTEGLFYILTFIGCLVIFPIVWHKGLLDGVHWHASAAIRRSRNLITAAVTCFLLALVNGMLMPGPVDAPIDKIFRMPGAAWMLFAFGVTLAPFFEELGFRGFLLPALSTGVEWAAANFSKKNSLNSSRESYADWDVRGLLLSTIVWTVPLAALYPDPRFTLVGRILFVALWIVTMFVWWAASNSSIEKRAPRYQLDDDGHPQWSMPAMVIASVLTSILFAAIHADQTGYSIGPFLLLICVSLVLCWARLSTRSLAASVLVHACYNFLLFTVMLVGTGGFKHLDRM